MKKLLKNKKGFTLIEIIVVVVILAVLMAVSVPAVLSYINQADDAKYMAQARGAYTAMQAELVKAYVDDGKLDQVEIDDASTAAIATLGTSTPKVTDIKVDISGGKTPNDVTEYTVQFENATATVTPNGSVVITR